MNTSRRRALKMLSASLTGAAVASVVPFAAAPAAAAGALYPVDLGVLPGTTQSNAMDVNDHGVVVGNSSGGAGGATRAFRWRSGVMIDLGTLGGPSAAATAISNNGWIVGQSLLADGVTWHAFLWRQGYGMTDLGTLGGSSFAADINDSGHVVGYHLGPNGLRGFYYDQAGMVAFNNPAGGTYEGYAPAAISNWGFKAVTTSDQLGLVEDDGTLRLSGLLGSSANGMNLRGDIVGSWDLPTQGDSFVWQADGTVRTLQTPAGSTYATGCDINDDGDVAGLRQLPDGTSRAVFWSEAGVAHSLPGLAADVQSAAFAINKYGLAAGRSQVSVGGAYHAVLWTR